MVCFGLPPVHDTPSIIAKPSKDEVVAAYDPKICAVPVKRYKPEIITSSKKISDIISSLNNDAILIPPTKRRKINEPLADIMSHISATHQPTPPARKKPKGSINVPVTTRKTIWTSEV